KHLSSKNHIREAILASLKKLDDASVLHLSLEKLLVSKTLNDQEISWILDYYQEQKIKIHLMSEILTQIEKPTPMILDYLHVYKMGFPNHWLQFLKSNRKSALYLSSIIKFQLYDFFQLEWQEHWDQHQSTFPFEQFHKIQDSKIIQWIDQRVSDKNCISYQKFLLLNHSFYPNLKHILANPELKIELSKELIQSYSEWVENSPVKDLLFLMLSDDESKISLAKQYFLRGDIEYYMFLVNRFFTHGQDFGKQIICSLYEFRSDKAIQLLVEGMKQKILSNQQIVEIFHWIHTDPCHYDEFLNYLQREKQLKIDLIQEIFLHLENCPELLTLYIKLNRLFTLEDLCKQIFTKYPKHHRLFCLFSKIAPQVLKPFLIDTNNHSRFAKNFNHS
ncbi:hypothetical protein MJH12_08560, partial [bacterium]|nr:hypothetical protein [bacterium]